MRRCCSSLPQAQAAFTANHLPTVFVLVHDVFMSEEVFTAFPALELPQGVIFTRVGFDDAKRGAVAVGAGVLHQLTRSK